MVHVILKFSTTASSSETEDRMEIWEHQQSPSLSSYSQRDGQLARTPESLTVSEVLKGWSHTEEQPQSEEIQSCRHREGEEP